MREGKIKLPRPTSQYYRARYQCESCGYTGYRSYKEGNADNKTEYSKAPKIRESMYCAGDCDANRRPHRLVDITWNDPVPLPTGEPCLLDGNRYKATIH